MNLKEIISKIGDNKQKRIAQLIQKNYLQRSPEQIHQLSLAFKKRIVDMKETSDWKMIVMSIQFLTLATSAQINIVNVLWIYVIEGSLQYHGMIFNINEHLTITLNEYSNVKMNTESIYAILTKRGYKKAIYQNQAKKINQQKKNTRQYIFQGAKIREKDFNILWESIVVIKTPKNQQIDLHLLGDMIFIVFEGHLTIQYKWKKAIKIRQIGPGSMFSTYLGRYLFRNSEDIIENRHMKYQFKYVATQQTITLGFNPDIFYENQRFADYKFVVENAWSLYLQRVDQAKRIIEGYATMKPEKKEVIKDIRKKLEEQELRERLISVPVAIQKRKFRKIIYQFFDEKSNRRKIPNLVTKSARTLPNHHQNGTEPKQTSENKVNYNIKFKLKTTRSKRSLTQYSGDTRPQQHKSEKQMKTLQSLNRETTSSIHLLFTHQNTMQRALEQPHTISTTKFFKPEQFLSRKLRTQYEFISRKTQKLNLPAGQSEHIVAKKQFKNQKQYFEHYVNERRIVKLGPKKRLLYKRRPGF